MTLALIAGQGDLPEAVLNALPQRPLICALEGSLPDHVTPDIVFCVETLGGLLAQLRRRGIVQICMCGRVARPDLSLTRLDWRTLRLLPLILRALRRGDDGALRIVIGLMEQAGFEVRAAHEVAPVLLPPNRVLTRVHPDEGAALAAAQGDKISDRQAAEDLGQACVVTAQGAVQQETEDGTDAMLKKLTQDGAGAVLYKAPKPGQDRRADLPVIGVRTAQLAAQKRLAGIVIEAQGVMVLNLADVIRELDANGLFLWVRERPV